MERLGVVAAELLARGEEGVDALDEAVVVEADLFFFFVVLDDKKKRGLRGKEKREREREREREKERGKKTCARNETLEKKKTKKL